MGRSGTHDVVHSVSTARAPGGGPGILRSHGIGSGRLHGQDECWCQRRALSSSAEKEDRVRIRRRERKGELISIQTKRYVQWYVPCFDVPHAYIIIIMDRSLIKKKEKKQIGYMSAVTYIPGRTSWGAHAYVRTYTARVRCWAWHNICTDTAGHF